MVISCMPCICWVEIFDSATCVIEIHLLLISGRSRLDPINHFFYNWTDINAVEHIKETHMCILLSDEIINIYTIRIMHIQCYDVKTHSWSVLWRYDSFMFSVMTLRLIHAQCYDIKTHSLFCDKLIDCSFIGLGSC